MTNERESPLLSRKMVKLMQNVWRFFFFTPNLVSLLSSVFFFSKPRKHRLRFLFSGAGRGGRLSSKLIFTMSGWRRSKVRAS